MAEYLESGERQSSTSILYSSEPWEHKCLVTLHHLYKTLLYMNQLDIYQSNFILWVHPLNILHQKTLVVCTQM